MQPNHFITSNNTLQRALSKVMSWDTIRKVNRLNVVTYLNQTLTFEWCVVRCRSKERLPKIHVLKSHCLHAHNSLTDLGSIVKLIEGTYQYDHLRKKNRHFDNV